MSSCQYEEHGENFLDMLDEMFFFVLLDTRQQLSCSSGCHWNYCPLYGERLGQKTNEENILASMKNFILLNLPLVLDAGSVWISLGHLHDECENFEVPEAIPSTA